MNATALVVSCVVDSQRKYYEQCLVLIDSLLATGSARYDEIMVHVVEGVSERFVALLKMLGVSVVPVKRFGSEDSVYCNKLMQLRSKLLQKYDKIVLMDTDMAVVENVREAFLGSNMAAKVVDTPIPPLGMFRKLYKRASLPAVPKEVTSHFGQGSTFEGNCNGGLYVFSRDVFRRMAPLWLKWSHWVLSNKPMLGKFVKHADQIGFCLALSEAGVGLEALGLDMNFPTHLKRTSYAPVHDSQARILHYHANTGPDGRLASTGLDFVDRSIDKANRQLSCFKKTRVWDCYNSNV